MKHIAITVKSAFQRLIANIKNTERRLITRGVTPVRQACIAFCLTADMYAIVSAIGTHFWTALLFNSIAAILIEIIVLTVIHAITGEVIAPINADALRAKGPSRFTVDRAVSRITAKARRANRHGEHLIAIKTMKCFNDVSTKLTSLGYEVSCNDTDGIVVAW